MIAFAIIGAIGLFVLLVSVTLGEIADAFDVGDVGISSTAFAAALTGFGALGVLGSAAGLAVWLSIVLALVAAALAGWLTQLVIDHLAASDSPSPEWDVVGATGVVTSPTSPAGGEVRLDDPRDLETRLARSTDVLPAGARVVVTAREGSRVHVTSA